MSQINSAYKPLVNPPKANLNIPVDVNSEIPLHERWNDEIDEYSNGNRIYRDKDGFIISEKEWKEQNK